MLSSVYTLYIYNTFYFYYLDYSFMVPDIVFTALLYTADYYTPI